MPLFDHFKELNEKLLSSPITVIVVGLDQYARESILNWISGTETSLLSIAPIKRSRLIEVHFQRRGFVIEQPGKNRKEFESFAPFIDALREADLIRDGDPSSWVDPLRLKLAASVAGSHGLTLLMPESLESISDNPAAFNEAISRSNWLVVAGAADSHAESNLMVALNDWVRSVDVVWPIVFHSENEAPKPEHPSWWEDSLIQHESVNLPAAHIDLVQANQRDSPIVSAPVKCAVFLRWLSRRFEAAVEMLEDHQRKNEKTLRQRETSANRNEKHLQSSIRSSDAEARELLDGFRSELDEMATAIQRDLKEKHKKSFLPRGNYPTLASEWTTNIGEDQLEMKVEDLSRKMALSQDTVSLISDRLHEELRDGLKETVSNIDNQVEQVTESIVSRLEKLHGYPVALDIPPLSERSLWKDLQDIIEVDPDYELELPKRGAFEVIMAGRSSVFPIIMLLGLIGSSFMSELRGKWYFTVPLLGIWAIGSYLFVQKTKKQDNSKQEAELKKMKSSISQDVLRIAERAEKEKMDLVSEYLSNALKSVKNELKTKVSEAVAIATERSEKEIQAAKNSRSSIEKRRREVDSNRREIEQLEADFRRFESDCQGFLREASQGLKVPSIR